ncbi:hypothetical protein GLYMA_08G325700v4 [Glycine max]|uniref:FRIGIDA-like protein n=2 Tax=Glycine subgen. Soja TaxID=1462606 RepID=K7LAA1_SOYBN|nr:FRIGIDA-like protein 1 [Glycine max]XP_028246069.1 FRIGIDA-like protein 1 [Glycine soja]KAH1054200.1 hypothetical protein GYH30_023133 [Glycine max]KRH46301.1 hypothetical protein GLYMA_08G325700v4 [Glycine max]RZB99902.1 FRIGIDA-like protein 1 isoform A [Glycine soja]|eukprot:XP_003530783.1 FRIGIDA-like protein 1 [Glycine max]
MATLKTISAALNLVDSKKENLKKAFDNLHSLLSPLPLSWLDLDSHFTTLHHSLTHRFNLLQSHSQTLTPIPDPPPHTPQDVNFSSNPTDPSSNHDESSPGVSLQNDVVPGPVTPRNELVALCEKMDGVGLMNYVNDNFQDRTRVQAELPGAFRHAPDAGTMVLGALEVFHGEGSELKEWELRRIRKACIVLLKQFRVAALSVSAEASVRARELALEWKERLVGDEDNMFGALGLLHLICAFGFVSEFSLDELVDFSVAAPTNEEDFPELCRTIGLTERVPDIVQKLIDKDKHIPAVKYILEFNLADRISPVPILKACVEEAKKLGKRLFQEGKSLNESTSREINTLRMVIKTIESYKLESEYPLASLEQHIEQLKRQKTNNKHAAPTSAAKPPQHKQQQQQQQQKRNMQKQPQQTGIKRPRASAPVGSAAVLKNVNNVNSTIHHYQQHLVHPSGLFTEHPNPYMSLPAMPFGMVSPTPNVPPYAGPSAGPYGHDGVPMGPSGNPSLGGSHLSSSEPHVQAVGYYDRASTYGGIGLQHYYQASYYPQ